MLSVIIVGVAVAVGITMFNAQAQNSNRSALIADANNFATQALAYYKTPTSHGGGGRSFGTEIGNDLDVWLGFDTIQDSTSNDNGAYYLGWSSASIITITGTGTEPGNTSATNTKIVATVTATDASPIAMSIEN
ncbi:MAG: hypothetical protein P9L89_04175 [Candidatus Celaenobacter polaris]|nr:hypothetical protein [Candidatus Celaenobacter polaris]